ncbi:MAG: M20 family metallopeptidase [Reyranellaceae bacterium]
MNPALADSIVALASRLVATPSCAGIDAPDAVLAVALKWLDESGLRPRLLRDGEGGPVAVLVEIEGQAPGPVLCLDACIDTAPPGDPGQWAEQPFAGVVRGKRLLGRGAGDSKAGVAILAHVARQLAQEGLPRGAIHVLFDADEHTGRFGGVRAYLEAMPRPPDAASLGYPGNDCVVVGSRGFLRAKVTFFGKAAHSGEVERTGINALTKAAAFALKVAEMPLPASHDPAFPFGPVATITGLEGGEGFSVVPDRATCHIDIRLTRAFPEASAAGWLEEITRAVDGQARIEIVDHWPAYLVDADHPLARSFAGAASRAFGRPVPTDVCGPSNIGNLLAARGVATICAPGVTFGNMHAANEWADIDSIAPVYAMYCEAAQRFLSSAWQSN